MLDVAEALARLLAAAAPLPADDGPLDAALGRVLAEDVVADRDYPPSDRSAMDGFAVRSADCAGSGRTLAVVGEVRAGSSGQHVALADGQAARIFTGAVIPRGSDAVVMVERTEESADRRSVTILEPAAPGQNVRRRGEEARAGTTLVTAGRRLRAAEIAALASVGRTRVKAVRPPRVAVASTGDELVPDGVTPAPHQIRDSNARMLLAAVAEIGFEGRSLGTAADDAGSLDALIGRGLAEDALILTGGVSVGEYDLVRAAFERAGCEVLFHGVAMRPGKPILAARKGRALVFGLPGNPLSAFVGFQVFVAPALRALAGHAHPVASTVRATLVARLPRRPGRKSYALARFARGDGPATVAPVEHASSGDLLAMAEANAFIVADGDAAPLAAGETVDVLTWSGDPD